MAAAAEVNVYGVRCRHARAAPAWPRWCSTTDERSIAAAFKQHVDATLPAYARPLFVRVRPALETTGTLKLKKNDLQKQGFDPDASEDPIYFRDPARDEYVGSTPRASPK